MPLTDREIKTLKPKDKSYKVFDEKGLYIEVMRSGSKLWRLKYRFEGREKRLSIGAYPEVTLKIARQHREDAIVRLTQQVNVKFAFYYMQTTVMTDYIAKFNKTSAQPNINLKQISEFKIPVPTINEQIRIVKILDNFNTLTSSIKEGLPREIELRQKQYEYYRDVLLNFPKSHSDEAA